MTTSSESVSLLFGAEVDVTLTSTDVVLPGNECEGQTILHWQPQMHQCVYRGGVDGLAMVAYYRLFGADET
jgi:hypothetical protein